MAVFLKNTKKGILTTEQAEERCRNINICRFCEKEITIDKVRDKCLLTGKYRGSSHSNCNFNVT